MRNKNNLKIVWCLSLGVLLTGCFGGPEETTGETTTVQPKHDFSLTVIESTPPRTNSIEELFVEEIVEVEPVKKVELVKSYQEFSDIAYDQLKGTVPLALLFTQEDCERCKFLDGFLSRNLSVLPNYTQVLSVPWNEFENLQAELNVRRPATMVFFNADGSVAETLFAPPIDRITDFFQEAQPTL